MRRRLALAAAASLLITGCAASGADVVRYECERGGPLEVEYHRDEASFVLAGRRHRLPRVPSASGERWERDGVLLWTKGEEATVSIGDQVVAWGCRRNEPDSD